MRQWSGVILGAIAAVLASSCYTATGKSHLDGGADGDGAMNAPDLSNVDPNADLSVLPGADLSIGPDLATAPGCTGTLPLASVAPDILVILDMSGSTLDQPTGWTMTKWAAAAQGVGDAMVAVQQLLPQVNFGLYTFPNDGNCGVATGPVVAFSAGNAPAIKSQIANITPNGSSPVDMAVAAARDWIANVADGRSHHLVLVTDADPNCGSTTTISCTTNAQCPPGQTCNMVPLFGGQCSGSDVDPLVTNAIRAANLAGIPTYVVNLASTDTYLGQWAQVGGTSAGSKGYYDLTGPTATQTMGSVFRQIASCTFYPSPAPPSASGLRFTVGGNVIAQDTTHSGGWDYDVATGRVSFYGPPCSWLQQTPRLAVIAYTGCP